MLRVRGSVHNTIKVYILPAEQVAAEIFDVFFN